MNVAIRWLMVSAAVSGLCFILILFVDVPLELYCAGARRYLTSGPIIDTAPILAAGLFVALFLAIKNWLAWPGSRWEKAIELAAYGLLGAFVISDLVMKPIIGRLPVDGYLAHAGRAGFHILHGNYKSSFPSGHSAMLASVLTVFWKFYPRYSALYIGIILASSFVLVAGYWHFLSDVIAGSFIGFGTGLLNVSLWEAGSHGEADHAAGQS